MNLIPKAKKKTDFDKKVFEYFYFVDEKHKKSLAQRNRAQWTVEGYGTYEYYDFRHHTQAWTGKSLQKQGYDIFKIGLTASVNETNSYGVFMVAK